MTTVSCLCPAHAQGQQAHSTGPQCPRGMGQLCGERGSGPPPPPRSILWVEQRCPASGPQPTQRATASLGDQDTRPSHQSGHTGPGGETL